jgi:hypothetical protein
LPLLVTLLTAEAPASSAQAPQPASSTTPAGPSANPVQPAKPVNELDAFMARVLERRAEAWTRLHDYVLSERERFALRGPGGVRLHGLDREFTWYVRDGFFVRSPIRANGVALGDEARAKYENDWLARERRREERREAQARKTAQGSTEAAGGAPEDDPEPDDEGPVTDPESLVGRGEPRFVSEAYFLKFKFEPGNYYFAGREQLDGREVVRIEYYPSRMFSREESPEGRKPPRDSRGKRSEDEVERDVERNLDRTSLITLWVDPAEHQIVRYTFDNIGMGFLPGRWLVRVTDVRASMTMGRYFDGVWLPREITMDGGIALANGDYAFHYDRSFADYKRAETSAVVRGYAPQEE